jgi:NAD+ synthase (glutamine-hydrolysing)
MITGRFTEKEAMKPLRIAMAQFDFPVGAIDRNRDRIIELVIAAREELGADVVLFPELALTGYPPEDLLLRPAFLERAEVALRDIAAACRGITAVVGHPQSAGSVVYNAASVLRGGRIETTYRKRVLPNHAVFDERRYFFRGDSACVFEQGGVRIGVAICEDLWHAAPLADTAAAGAELVLVANASPYEADKPGERDALLLRQAQDNGVALAYLNTVGGQDELVFDGASVLADADGTIHPAACAFEDIWLLVEFLPQTRAFARLQWAEEADESRESLTWRALVRGLRDYLGKNGFRRALLGLSGGIDSAVTLALAVDALGAENVDAWMLPSRFTSQLSLDLAAEQAQLLGVRLGSLSIEAPFAGFLDVLRPAFGKTDACVAEENLQSRCRGALLMALSNQSGGLLLTTGNKSEYAVGYATIYGDMCGGYAPIKDLYKTEVYALARYRNLRGAAIPEGVIERAPSAELRENQTDQDSLPDYDTLDAILYRFVDLEQSQPDIVAAGFDAETVARVARLVFINEYKRRQSAPGPKVSRRAFGRERRYPISSAWR